MTLKVSHSHWSLKAIYPSLGDYKYSPKDNSERNESPVSSEKDKQPLGELIQMLWLTTWPWKSSDSWRLQNPNIWFFGLLRPLSAEKINMVFSWSLFLVLELLSTSSQEIHFGTVQLILENVHFFLKIKMSQKLEWN